MKKNLFSVRDELLCWQMSRKFYHTVLERGSSAVKVVVVAAVAVVVDSTIPDIFPSGKFFSFII